MKTQGSIEKLPSIGFGSGLNGPAGEVLVATPIRKRPALSLAGK